MRRRKSVDLAWLILNYRVRWIITRRVRYDDARIFINSVSNVKRGGGGGTRFGNKGMSIRTISGNYHGHREYKISFHAAAKLLYALH